MDEFPMHRAVVLGDLQKVRDLIHVLGVYLNGCNASGETPLIVAARHGHKKIFDLFIQYGAQINCKRDGEWTPLHWASYKGWRDQVRLILEKGGADLSVAANDGKTPLLLAAQHRHREIFDLLIQYGAQANCGRDEDGWTPLHWASYNGWLDQVRLILEKGDANLNDAANDEVTTPLIVAARKVQRETFDLLIQYGAHANCGRDENGWTPLHYASYNGWLDQVRLILEKGDANLSDAANDGETTPLILAASFEHREIFDLLIQYGAQANCGRDEDGCTPLHLASYNGWLDQVRVILEKGGADDLNAVANDGDTPLIAALSIRHREIYDLLIQYGAQANCGRDKDGWTTLHWASRSGWLDQVRFILEKGGADDLNAALNSGETPLIMAAKHSHREIFDLLIQYGAQANCGRDKDGWTPLHWASCRGWLDQVRLILEKGDANLNATNHGYTPLIVAARNGHKDIFVLLFQYGATEGDFALISQHSFLKDADLCAQLIVNKFYCQSLSALYRYPDIAKKLPLFEKFKLKDEQTQQIANFVESEVQTKKFCNVFKARPIVLMLFCVQSLLSHLSTRHVCASCDSN